MPLTTYTLQGKDVSRKAFLQDHLKRGKDEERLSMIDVIEAQYDMCIPSLQKTWEICTKQNKFDPNVCQVQLQMESQNCLEIRENIKILQQKTLPKFII